MGYGGKRQRGPAVLQLLLSSFLLFPPPFLDVVIAKIGKGHLSDPYMCLSHAQSYKELPPIQPAREGASKCQDGILASQLDVPSSRPTLPLPSGQQVEVPREFVRCTQHREATTKEQNGRPHIRNPEIDTCSQTDGGKQEREELENGGEKILDQLGFSCLQVIETYCVPA